jgi:flagellar basal-body rod protein FlgG
MNGAFEIAGVGLVAQQQALDVIANNISNVNTPGFKRSDVQFSELMATAANTADGLAQPDRGQAVAGVAARTVLALSDQGQIEQTGRPMDLAIEGAGFLELMGPGGQSLLWRGGPLSVDSSGLLGAGDGLALRSSITVPDGASDLRIAADGVVSATLPGESTRVELGQISLVEVDSDSALERLDGGFYRPAEGARLKDTTPGQDGAGSLAQGAIERSNVEINNEMVRLMIVQRAYAANAQIVQAADQLAAIANSLRR